MPESLTLPLQTLRQHYGDRLLEDFPLAKYTSARIGGPADALIFADSVYELAEAVEHLWSMDVPFSVLGGGCNMLVSDAGVRGVVLLNKASEIRVQTDSQPPTLWAGSGANLIALSRQAAQNGCSGLEWAVGIPGTLGGAIYGNAGAHGSEIADQLELAEVLHPEKGKQDWSPDQFDFSYRSSNLKRNEVQAVVLSATLNLELGAAQEIQKKMDRYLAIRRRNQPPGASMGSMFKNPKGDHAGRLIEAAGLKGYRIGGAEINAKHANFMINIGGATAADMYQLIQKARQTVKDEFGVELVLEIQLFGDWSQYQENI